MKRRFSTAVFLLIKNLFLRYGFSKKLTNHIVCVFLRRDITHKKQLKILFSCNRILSDQQLNKDFYYEQSGRNCEIFVRAN